ncbi:hypothetical protein DVH05_002570 [Phytophthora capsici]|nr:hypothetical protein DVH05_002570 [Phytophthora capsici]
MAANLSVVLVMNRPVVVESWPMLVVVTNRSVVVVVNRSALLAANVFMLVMANWSVVVVANWSLVVAANVFMLVMANWSVVVAANWSLVVATIWSVLMAARESMLVMAANCFVEVVPIELGTALPPVLRLALTLVVLPLVGVAIVTSLGLVMMLGLQLPSRLTNMPLLMIPIHTVAEVQILVVVVVAVAEGVVEGVVASEFRLLAKQMPAVV